MKRREWMKSAGGLLASLASVELAGGDVPDHLWQGYDFGPGPTAPDRLNQGPFGIEQDESWYTIAATAPARGAARNFGLGLVGSTWEEGGPSIAARRGAETLEQHVETNLNYLSNKDEAYGGMMTEIHAYPAGTLAPQAVAGPGGQVAEPRGTQLALGIE